MPDSPSTPSSPPLDPEVVPGASDRPRDGDRTGDATHRDLSAEAKTAETAEIDVDADDVVDIDLGDVDLVQSVPAPAIGPASAAVAPPPAISVPALTPAEATARLRAEAEASEDGARRARLLNEIAEIAERGGDDADAARDYLAAYNADPSFREPLEGLLRLTDRRRSPKNRRKVLEALAEGATNAEERARAQTLYAAYLEDIGRATTDGAESDERDAAAEAEDAALAREAALAAAEADAPPGEAGPAWLTLEMVAARAGDTELRARALAERAERTTDPAWRGLLWLDVAALAVAAGETDRAIDVLDEVRGDSDRAGTAIGFVAARAIERAVLRDPGDGDVGTRRARALARALETQGERIFAALGEAGRDEAARGADLGVPAWARTAAHLADAWLRASDARRRAGETAEAGALLDRALEAAFTFGGDARVIATLSEARMRAAEAASDPARAAAIAEARLASDGETDAGLAASLAMRVAEEALARGDEGRALEAIARAVARDPESAPARAMQIDRLAVASERAPDDVAVAAAAALATQIDALAAVLGTDAARARAGMLAAYVWATRTDDVAAARGALGRATTAATAATGAAAASGGAKGAAQGADAERAQVARMARFARMLAATRGDVVWYEEATRRLATVADAAERVHLWIEIFRMRAARGDVEGGRTALAELVAGGAGGAGGATLGRALEAILPIVVPEWARTPAAVARGAAALDEMAREMERADPAAARSLDALAAARALAGGDVERGRARLRELSAREPGDALVAAWRADVERQAATKGRAEADRAESNAGAPTKAGGAADVGAIVRACAEATEDVELAAALWLEVGLEAWRDGDRAAAIDAFRGAKVGAEDAAKMALAWGTRGVAGASIEARRAAIERAAEAGGDARLVAIERFATEIHAGDADAATDALYALEHAATDGDLAIAAALARVAWTPGAGDGDAMRTALARIGAAGTDANVLAAAEQLRLAREGDGEDVVDAARTWFDAGGALPAAIEWLAATSRLSHKTRQIAPLRSISAALPKPTSEQVLARAAMIHLVATPDEPPGFLPATTHAARLVNLEAAPPGSDPRRRATALAEVDGALGEDAQVDAVGLSGWSWLVAGDPAAAEAAFRAATTARPADIVAWEGLRAAAEAQKDAPTIAAASAKLGALSCDAARGAELWEDAATIWFDAGDDARGEAALDAAFARDPKRATSFDRLFRRVRAAGDADRLLALIERRVPVTDEPAEIAKLFWEKARTLRAKGDSDGALAALENVTMLEPEHVGALALTGEIFIRRGMYEPAADHLARLARIEDAPPKNRVTAGVAAVDLFENKLDQPERALEILLLLHRAKLSTPPVRERLARAATKTSSWNDATAILEELMLERAEASGRIEAARLAMAIHRDRLRAPEAARTAVLKLLDEAPADPEALEMLLSYPEGDERRRVLERARTALVAALATAPTDLANVRLLSRVARALGDGALEHVALSTALALGAEEPGLEAAHARFAAKARTSPQVALSDDFFRRALAPGDDGPTAELFRLLGPTIAEALGPSLVAAGVTKKERVDPRSGIALRNEIAAWAGAFGVAEFELYVGGADARGVLGIPGEPPALVVGADVKAPLSAETRARLARELVAMVRGSTVTRWRDETSIAAIAVAACRLAEVPIEAPAYAVLTDIERQMGKVMSRRTKKAIAGPCAAIAATHADAAKWSKRALASHDRFAAIASGDVAVVLADVLGDAGAGKTRDRAEVAREHARGAELLRFVLSPLYLDLRRALGLGEGA